LGLLNISNIWPVHQHMRDRDPPEENEEVFKKARLARPQLIGRAERTEEYVSTAKWRERRWPACRSWAQAQRHFSTLPRNIPDRQAIFDHMMSKLDEPHILD
jgi:hypothetical protein